MRRRDACPRRWGALLLALAGAAALGLALSPSEAPAAGRATPPVTFQWDRYAPKGSGISVLKPTSLKLAPRKAAVRGYRVHAGREPQTGTRLTLYVTSGKKTQAELEQDLYALTGQPAKAWLAVLQRGPTSGFSWQRALYRQSPTHQTQSALLLAHGTRPLSYIVLVEVDFTVGSRNAKMFDKAYRGLHAVP